MSKIKQPNKLSYFKKKDVIIFLIIMIILFEIFKNWDDFKAGISGGI